MNAEYASVFAVRSRLPLTKVGEFRATKHVERCRGRKAVRLPTRMILAAKVMR